MPDIAVCQLKEQVQLRITFIGSLCKKICRQGIKSFYRRKGFFQIYERAEGRINFGWSIAIHKYFMAHFSLYKKPGSRHPENSRNLCYFSAYLQETLKETQKNFLGS